jgi:glycosyltransferase involved in cell wall biosynthesis
MGKITVIMPFLNEEKEPVETVKSINATSPEGLVDIIAIDDGSKNPISFGNFSNVKYIRNKERMGVDGCRQLGCEMAETPYLFVIDAHMRFKTDDWAEKLIEGIEREPKTIWCTTCLGLGYGTMDLTRHKGKYYGATMLFIDENAKPNRPAREVLEPKWAPKKGDDEEYSLPCVLGANYAFSKEWFEHIKGLEGLKMWGTSEPFLSMKSYFAGGDNKIRTDIEIGHKFRSNAPYVTGISHLVYNKIFLCKTILPEELGNKLINFIPKDKNFEKALLKIKENEETIQEHRDYYSGIFSRDIYDYCEAFDLYIPK